MLVQIYLGALVAGLRAGYVYNTWPLIDGALVPDRARLFFDMPLWRNFFREHADGAVRSPHACLCDLVICALLHAFDVARFGKKQWVVSSATVLAAAVTVQAALGILTLLDRVPISLALMHQAMAMLVLTVATTARRAMSPARAASTAHAASCEI